MMVLPKIPKNIIKQVKNLIQDFMWNGHKPKISLEQLQKSKETSGLGLVNLSLKDQSLKISWVELLNTNKSFANLVYNTHNLVLNDLFWKCNLAPKDIKWIMNIPQSGDTFSLDVAMAWFSFKKNLNRNTDTMV